jgi:hypothetical protein
MTLSKDPETTDPNSATENQLENQQAAENQSGLSSPAERASVMAEAARAYEPGNPAAMIAHIAKKMAEKAERDKLNPLPPIQRFHPK